MWSKISSALKPREGNDGDPDHSDAQSTARRPPPDPFRANATTYYTHQTPATPPSGVHSRTASREEDIIWSLRTQLALQQEICAQFEIDLGARDELVEALTIRLETSEKENEKRKNVVRSWKKKTADLEKMCRHLEEEVDYSRQESMERSIMDEASGEALRQLHRQISQLEREKNDVEVERNSLAQTVKNAEVEITNLKAKFGTTDEVGEEAVRHLLHRTSQLERERSDLEVERNTLAQAVEKAEAEVAKLRGELNVTDEASVEALRQLHGQISQLEREKHDIYVECNTLSQAKGKADIETAKLKEEFDASNEANREALCRLHDQISQLEREKSDVEAEGNSLARAMEKANSDLSQLQQEKGDVETERDNFTSEISRLRAHIQQLQKDSAVMEVTIVQLNKQLDQDKEDIDGLNIALESKQQELELVKRKHGARGTVGSIPGRTSAAPSTAGKPVVSAGLPSKVLRTSSVGTRTSSPILPRVPSALGRAANTKPPVTSALRRASTSSAESKTKLSSRRVSIASTPSEADEKENASTPIPEKNPRRTMVPA
ncbi:hypothetical protein J3R83DRAFT_11340 [Lanmaoa asiatica]|nr:hypothetical protein J3R83DRAFT_11340 [Lanmaoa asiatica]